MKRHTTSLSELAALFGKSPATLQGYAHRGCPCRTKDKDDRGRYNVAAVRRWLKENGYLDKRAPNPAGGGAGRNGAAREPSETQQLRRWQAEERQHKAELARLELERRRGDLVSVQEVRDCFRRKHEYVLETLQNWARRLGPELTGLTAVEINRRMGEKIKELMDEFGGTE